MFIVLGILSILLGCFVFSKSSIFLNYSLIFDDMWARSASYIAVSLSLIIAGSISIASHDGKRARFVYRAMLFYLFSLVSSLIQVNHGYMPLFSLASGALSIYYAVWVFRHRYLVQTNSDLDVSASNDLEE
jgi:hypothetical protein